MGVVVVGVGESVSRCHSAAGIMGLTGLLRELRPRQRSENCLPVHGNKALWASTNQQPPKVTGLGQVFLSLSVAMVAAVFLFS